MSSKDIGWIVDELSNERRFWLDFHPFGLILRLRCRSRRTISYQTIAVTWGVH